MGLGLGLGSDSERERTWWSSDGAQLSSSSSDGMRIVEWPEHETCHHVVMRGQ